MSEMNERARTLTERLIRNVNEVALERYVREPPEICEYPDSGKYLAEGSLDREASFKVIDRHGDSLDYWDGEP